MPTLDEQYLDAIDALAVQLDDRSVTWALTGSVSFALQGVPVTPNDVDVQTTAAGAYEIESAFADRVVDPVSLSAGERIKSHFGALELDGVRVEIMGAVQKRRADGTWEPPVDITAHRTVVDVGGRSIPALSLRYEAAAYERLGRSERAALLSSYAER